MTIVYIMHTFPCTVPFRFVFNIVLVNVSCLFPFSFNSMEWSTSFNFLCAVFAQSYTLRVDTKYCNRIGETIERFVSLLHVPKFVLYLSALCLMLPSIFHYFDFSYSQFRLASA